VKRKSISDSQSVKKRLRREVQPAHTNESTAKIVGSSSPIQTQLSAIRSNNDIGLYPNSEKAVKDDRKHFNPLLANSYTVTPENCIEVYCYGARDRKVIESSP